MLSDPTICSRVLAGQVFHGDKMLFRRLALLRTLISREIATRYRGSFLGILWSIITPLIMLAVYAFVFGSVFEARKWDADNTKTGTTEFSFVLFSGLIVFSIIAETLSRSTTLIRNNRNYAKKIVFPLDTLVIVVVGSAVFQAMIGFFIMLIAVMFLIGHLSWTIFLLPIVIAPYLIMLSGLGWIVAGLAVYVRDIEQIMPPAITALMFLSAIFYPIAAIPERVREIIVWINPAIVPIEEVRKILLFGMMPNWYALMVYALAAVAIAFIGHAVFVRLSRGFADVL
jgi:lipopolysaccharide transport system permease protein